MIDLKKLSVLAITALLVTGISGITTAAAAKPAPTTTPLPTTSLTALITSLINSVGDDTFSTIDLGTLVSTFTSPLATPLHASTSAARTQVAPSSSGSSTQHYGPYASGSPDSSTCGNNWADDTFNRHFTVFQNNDGSFLVVEQFKDGSFLTPSTTQPSPAPPNPPNSSPGGCQNSATTQGLVNNGVTGSMHGYFVVPLPSGTIQISHDPSCLSGSPNAPCTTTDFINSHFSGNCYATTCPVTTFFFHYNAGGQGLIINEWKNASSDRGGNSGDIRSANVP
jgi:hypothetical protein